MDRTDHVRLTEEELFSSQLEGASIYGANDEKVGTVSEVLVNGDVIVEVGGSFLGMGAKSVSVPTGQFEFMRYRHGEIYAVTSWTKDEFQDKPEYEA